MLSPLNPSRAGGSTAAALRDALQGTEGGSTRSNSFITKLYKAPFTGSGAPAPPQPPRGLPLTASPPPPLGMPFPRLCGDRQTQPAGCTGELGASAPSTDIPGKCYFSRDGSTHHGMLCMLKPGKEEQGQTHAVAGIRHVLWEGIKKWPLLVLTCDFLLSHPEPSRKQSRGH